MQRLGLVGAGCAGYHEATLCMASHAAAGLGTNVRPSASCKQGDNRDCCPDLLNVQAIVCLVVCMLVRAALTDLVPQS
jgi:hypothetical protein